MTIKHLSYSQIIQVSRAIQEARRERTIARISGEQAGYPLWLDPDSPCIDEIRQFAGHFGLVLELEEWTIYGKVERLIPHISSRATLHVRNLLKERFTGLHHTGGGCWAWTLTFPEPKYVSDLDQPCIRLWLTDADNTMYPDPDSPLMLHLLDREDQALSADTVLTLLGHLDLDWHFDVDSAYVEAANLDAAFGLMNLIVPILHAETGNGRWARRHLETAAKAAKAAKAKKKKAKKKAHSAV